MAKNGFLRTALEKHVSNDGGRLSCPVCGITAGVNGENFKDMVSLQGHITRRVDRAHVGYRHRLEAKAKKKQKKQKSKPKPQIVSLDQGPAMVGAMVQPFRIFELDDQGTVMIAISNFSNGKRRKQPTYIVGQEVQFVPRGAK